MIGRLCIAAVALAVSFSSAHACRVPNDPEAARLQKQRHHKETADQADVIVKGRLYERSDSCDPTRHCGDWIQAFEARKGVATSYYLIDPDEALIVCGRDYVRPGKVGTFHLESNGNGMFLILDDIR